MFFRLCSALATFKCLIETVLYSMCLFQTVCPRQITNLVHAKSFSQELVHLQMVCDKLKNANLKLNPKKCELF